MPKKLEAVVTTVREVCQWCATEMQAGQNPCIWGTCAECRTREAQWLATPACPNCGARAGLSVAGVHIKDGHRDNCITRAKSPMVTTHV
jgi:hypothetical protein